MNILKYIMLLFPLVMLQSCVKDEEPKTYVNVENKSKYTDILSHRAGENCMECHFAGGSGKGFFSVAGTVYDSTKMQVYPNRLIKLFSEPNGNGNLIAEIPVDGKGNFFTTDTISFSGNVYAGVFSIGSNPHFMSAKLSHGQCSKCHGKVQTNIWIK